MPSSSMSGGNTSHKPAFPSRIIMMVPDSLDASLALEGADWLGEEVACAAEASIGVCSFGKRFPIFVCDDSCLRAMI